MGFLLDTWLNRLLKRAQDDFIPKNRVNIIVAGKTGVGKSTLINAVFREELAKTGIGEPITQSITKITKHDVPLCIYDTRGFELDKEAQEQVKREIEETIDRNLAFGNEQEYIHCMWYCINALSNRIEEEELLFIHEIATTVGRRLPIFLVLTQAINQSQYETLVELIREWDLPIVNVIPVVAMAYPITDEIMVQPHGLDTLVQETNRILPEAAKQALSNAQIVDLKLKVDASRAVINKRAKQSFLIGSVPIPFADAPFIVMTQISMIGKVHSTFGLKLNSSTITSIVSILIGTSLTTNLGRSLVGGITKLVPGVGTVGGAVISGSTAAFLTKVLGEAYLQIIVSIAKGEISEESLNRSKGKEAMKQTFDKVYRDMRKKEREEDQKTDTLKDSSETGTL